MPESFALASVLNNLVSNKRHALIYLLVFALAAPLGLLGSSYISQQKWLSGQASLALWGIVSGSLIHISTTIFFEASPDHHLSKSKYLTSLSGAVLAIICEFLL